MTTQGKFLVGVALMIAAVGYLMYTGIRETSTYYLTLEEFLPQKEALANAGVRVAGRVKSGSVDWNPKNLKLNFTMIGLDQNGQPVTTPGRGLAVHYQGVLPDMFAEGRDVIVEGEYTPGVDTLHATTVMTSCPSKYEAELDEANADSQSQTSAFAVYPASLS